jgi:hypothetical protein
MLVSACTSSKWIVHNREWNARSGQGVISQIGTRSADVNLGSRRRADRYVSEYAHSRGAAT